MRVPFDQLGKDVAAGTLDPTGTVQTEAEVPGRVRRVDLAFEPDPAQRAARELRGLLGRMGHEPCILELFQKTPLPGEVLRSVQKQLALMELRSVREGRRPVLTPKSHPVLWVVSSGRPKKVLAHLGMKPMPAWPPGFYEAAAGLRLRVVVVRELPRTRETLMLRLMGRGRVLLRAVAEVEALPPGAWEREIALPALVELQLALGARGGLQSAEERGLMMRRLERYEELKKTLLEEGEALGRREGEALGRREGEARIRQRLLAGLARTYRRRFGEPSVDWLAALDATHDPELLEGWVELFALGS